MKIIFSLFIICLSCLSVNSESISRSDFPDGFIFGTASSAYQFEGAVDEGNKGISIWDTFIKRPGRILDFSNANTAVDQYHRFQSDIELMKNIGMDAYRFSISWTRIFPNGAGEPNPEGIEYYNNLIDALLEKGIQPYVTLFHWDLPQKLEDSYEGFLSNRIIQEFERYAITCFKAFGDRVKHWITFNEPHGFTIQGYDLGVQAPGRCSLLFHMFDLTKTKLLRFLDPLLLGNYPLSMQKLVAERLPNISPQESKLLKGSIDFLGINHYTTLYARNDRARIMKFMLNDAYSDSLLLQLSGVE